MTASADTGFDPPPAPASPAPAAPPAAAAPLTASARLRAAREAQGLTVADVAARTRITLRHVRAVDEGDFASLPGRPYAIGFARSYARAVGLDEGEIATAVRAELGTRAIGPEPRVINQFEVDDPAKTPSRRVTWLALVLFLVLLVTIVLFLPTTFIPSIGLPSLVEPAPQQTAAAPAAPHSAAPAPAPAPTGPVVFTAMTDKLWVKFYDGKGTQLLQKQLAQGESYTVPADAVDPKLWTGRPDALSITIGGRAIPRLADHEGIMKDVPVTAAALLARSAPPAPGTTPPVTATAAAPVTGPRPVVRRRPAAGATAPVAPAATPTAAADTPAAPAPAAAPSPAG